MNKNTTKVELLHELEVLQRKHEAVVNANKHINEENKTLRKKAAFADIAQGGTFEYLFEAHNPTHQYLEELLNKTTFIRKTTFFWPTRRQISEVRRFHDGNQICIQYVTDFSCGDRRGEDIDKIIISFFKKLEIDNEKSTN